MYLGLNYLHSKACSYVPPYTYYTEIRRDVTIPKTTNRSEFFKIRVNINSMALLVPLKIYFLENFVAFVSIKIHATSMQINPGFSNNTRF